jgi:Rod binding domain-containing protein
MSSISDVPAGMAGQGFPASKADQLLGTVARAKPVPSKIEGAARQFESILIAKWLEDAENSFAKLPGEENDPAADPGQDQFRSMAQQFLSDSISAAGGLGIAAMIVKKLQPDSQPTESKEVTASRAATTPGASTYEY